MINKHLLYAALVLWSVGMSQACRGFSLGKNTDSIIHIPDANFKRCLLENHEIDTNKDGEIQLSETQNFQGKIRCLSKEIKTLKGIEYFTKLTGLYCSDNALTSLNVSKNVDLKMLDCGANKLTSLDVSRNGRLVSLMCHENKLKQIELGVINLRELHCTDNQLTNLDISLNSNMGILYCENNRLSSLVLNRDIRLLSCKENQLTSLNVGKSTYLEYVDCSKNQLSALDVSQNNRLKVLSCQDNTSNLSCIKINEKHRVTKWEKDETATFSTSCK